MKSAMLAFHKKSPATQSAPFVVAEAHLQSLARAHHESYIKADPFPHCVIDDFLPTDVAQHLLDLFPKPDAPFGFDWQQGDTTNEPRKQGLDHIKKLEGADPLG